jgi:serine/threonine-protein kinase HipA
VRKKLGPVLHLSRHNIFGFLQALGGDCAGAISLWPEGCAPNEAAVRLVFLDEEEAHAVLAGLRKRPLYVNGIDGYRISGAGAQSKLIARLVDGHIALPLYGMPSTHIVKPPMEEYPDSVFNECFSMRLAERLGIAAARCGIIGLKADAFYWTERYDRSFGGDSVQRLHQEDFCQILGVSGERKYESEGGPSFADCMKVMAEMCLPLSDRLSFIDRAAFNFLIGNADAHGKNSSVLYTGSAGRRLAPVYDAMSTAVYENLSRESAMSIGGARHFNEVRRESFSAMAAEIGMRPALVLARLDGIAKKIIPCATAVAGELSADWPSDVYGKILEVVNRHVAAIKP